MIHVAWRVKGLTTNMALLQMSIFFQLKPIFLFSLPPQHKVGPSSSLKSPWPLTTLKPNDSYKCLVFNPICEDFFWSKVLRKSISYMKDRGDSKILGTTKLPWANLCLMRKVKCTKFVVRFALLWKGNITFWSQSLIACWMPSS